MNVADLSQQERIALVALARHLILVDDRFSDRELYDLLFMGVAMGRPDFAEALEATEAVYQDRSAVLDLASAVESVETRSGILTELERIAEGDGLHPAETAFIDEVRARWA